MFCLRILKLSLYWPFRVYRMAYTEQDLGLVRYITLCIYAHNQCKFTVIDAGHSLTAHIESACINTVHVHTLMYIYLGEKMQVKEMFYDCCVVCGDVSDVSMHVASSVCPMVLSVSIRVFHVAGCFPPPRIHLFRISNTICVSLSWQSKQIWSISDPILSSSNRVPSLMYSAPTSLVTSIVVPVMVGKDRNCGSVGCSSVKLCDSYLIYWPHPIVISA